MFASSDNLCATTNASSFDNCANTNYLYSKTSVWTIDPAASTIYAINDKTIEESATNTVKATLPVVFIKSNAKIVSGSGTSSKPYIISD